MKKFFIVLGVILLGLLVVVGINYAKYLNSDEVNKTFIAPRLEYNAFVFKEINPEYVTLEMIAALDNPMPIGFMIDSFSYTFYIEDHEVFTSTYAQSIDFDAGDISFIRVPVTLYNEPLTRILDSLKMNEADSATYRVKGNFYANFPIVKERQIQFDREIIAPAYKVPTTKIIDWDFETIKKGEAIVNFQVMIINFNVFPYNFKDLEYKIDLAEDKMVLEGDIPGSIDIGAQDTGYVTLPAKLDLSEFGGAVWEYIKKGDHIKYDFESTLYLASESKSINGSKVQILASGTLDEVKQLAAAQ